VKHARLKIAMKNNLIHLYTAATPNGVKVPLALEELGIPWQATFVDLSANQQKSKAFVAMNPNARIPVLVDAGNAAEPTIIFESGAILLYLAEKFNGLLPASEAERAAAFSWLFLQVSGTGPAFGNAAFFRRQPEQNEAAQNRFESEALRLTTVVENRLKASPWLAGSEYSIADIAHFGWLRSLSYAGLELDAFPAIAKWLARIEQRPATAKALSRMTMLPVSRRVA
jgi:GST-like protein